MSRPRLAVAVVAKNVHCRLCTKYLVGMKAYRFVSTKGTNAELVGRLKRAGHGAALDEGGAVIVQPFGKAINDDYFDSWVDSMERHFGAEYAYSVFL